MNRRDRRRAAKQGAGLAAAPGLVRTPPEPARLVAQGVQLHQMGRLAEAEQLYRRALGLAPDEPDALHFLGLIAHQRGDNAEAIALIGRAIARDGRVAAYHSNLAEAYRALERNADAIRCYRKALELNPAMAEARFGLGTALLEDGAYDESARELTMALRADPNDAEAHLNLGNALSELGRDDEAIRHYERAAALRPELAAAHLDLGIALKARGELRRAYDALARAVEHEPRLAAAHYQIGTVLVALERHDEAGRAFRQALALAPDLVEALVALGDVLRAEHKGEEAIACYERAAALRPESLDPLHGIGHTRLEQGRFDAAREWFAKALERDPRSAEAHVDMGLSYQFQGRFEEARPWHEKAIALDPRHAGAHFHLVMSRKSGPQGERIGRIERVLALDSLSKEQRIALNFALAKSYDDLGDWDAAFARYKAANDLKKSELGFQPEAATAYVERMIAAFDAELFARKAGIGSESELPVFVFGMPRSGTTLVEQIIASHPQAHGAGELDYMRQIAQALPAALGTDEGFPKCIERLDAASARAIAEAHIATLRGHSADALRITDKLPNNFLRLGLIALLFPRARLIHCTRDPLDTCLSCYFQEFAHGQPFAYDLDHLGRYYRAYRRMMEHWRRVLPVPILDVSYEALVADQETGSRQLIAFLGLPWDERCLAFHENERLVRTASFWQVRQPLYASSVGRWRRYAKHLGPLLAALEMPPPS